ncbi:MAG: SDR family NAD(P)-dependent oxidoreductase [Patescibacteria group bacterium]
MRTKTILITGAGSGIGKDTALTLSRRGHTVIATTETQHQAIELELFAKGEHLPLVARALDITIESDRQSIAVENIDVLINAAAIGESGPLSEIPLDRLRKNFETNVFSTIAISQIALKKMIEKNAGTVLVISSIAGRIPSEFMTPYSMTKFALSGGIASMRKEVHRVASHVHVSLIEPGAYRTGFNQKMFATKYEWLKEGSAYFNMVTKLKREDYRFGLIEMRSTASIVGKIVSAAEARKPRLRYTAPWYQAVLVQVLRIFGK